MATAPRLPKWFFSLCCTLAITAGSFSMTAAQDGNASVDKAETIKCNTKVEWHADWREAFALAEKSNKPLFVLHLSGNLQNEAFT